MNTNNLIYFVKEIKTGKYWDGEAFNASFDKAKEYDVKPSDQYICDLSPSAVLVIF